MAKSNKNVVSAGLCTSSNLAGCAVTDVTLMPSKLYSRRNFVIPMSQPDIDANFPPEFEIFRSTTNAITTTQKGVTTVTSNLIGGDEVPCPFLMCGICLQVSVEPNAWTVNGGEFSIAPGTPPVDPPNFPGTFPLVNPTGFEATLEYGGASWRAAIAMLQAYNLRMLLQCKYELFEIPLSDIGCIDSTNDVQATGDTLIAAGIGAQRANQQYWNIGSSRQFLLPNSQAPAGSTQNTDQAFQATTRSVYGGPKSQGGLGGFYLCPVPILLAPCCRINMSFREVGESALSSGGSPQYDRLISEISDQAPAPVGPGWTGNVAGAAPGTALIRNFKFAQWEFGVIMVGYELTAAACEQYFANGLPAGLADMYSMIPQMPGLAALKASQ